MLFKKKYKICKNFGGGTVNPAETGERHMTDKNEKCVCCGSDTGIAENTPIPERKWYVKGSGQLCEKCYLNLYGSESDGECRFSNEEIEELLKLCCKQ